MLLSQFGSYFMSPLCLIVLKYLHKLSFVVLSLLAFLWTFCFLQKNPNMLQTQVVDFPPGFIIPRDLVN